MAFTASARAAARALLGARRDIGPLGTAGRVAVGLVAIALPIAFAGFDWWDALGAFLVLPLLVALVARVVTAAYRRLGLGPLAGARGAICSPAACLLVAAALGATVALGVLTPASGDVVFWVWLGASMLVAAARGYGGCEVLAVPNLLSGRREEVGCLLFGPIDRAEARRSRNAMGAPVRARP